MADETLSRDPNRITVNGGVTNDSDLDIVMFRVDPITKRLLVDAGEITVTGAGDGAILDGVNSAIKATVLDYTNSNPIAVRLTNTDGDYVGAGAGTQYSDGAANASPTGTVAMGTDGANIFALLTDTSGHLQIDVISAPTTAVTGTFWQATQPVSLASVPSHVVTATDLDIRNLTNVDVVTAELSAVDNAVLDVIAAKDFATQTTLALIKAKTDNIPALGQALAASSVPVILPAATITTLTPPAAITGFSTETTLASLLAKFASGTVIGDVNLGATDNAVLDTIDSVLDTINAKLVTGTDIGDVTINNAAGAAAVNIQDGGNAITVDGTVAVTNAGTFAVQAAATLAAETTKVIGTVNVAASQTIAVTQATATNLKCEEASASAIKTAVELLDNSVDGNYLNVNMNIAGVDVSATVPMPVRPNEYDLATASTTHVKKYYTNAGAVTDGIIWSPAAGKRWFVTDIYIQVSAAATVTLEDDLAAGDSPIWKAELAANSGWSHSFQTPWFSGEDAADLIITTTAGNVYVTCVGYEI